MTLFGVPGMDQPRDVRRDATAEHRLEATWLDDPDQAVEQVAVVAFHAMTYTADRLRDYAVGRIDHPPSPAAVGADHVGAPASGLDAVVSREIAGLAARLLPGVLLLGEENPPPTRDWQPGDAVLIVDDVDGTSVVEDRLCGGAIVMGLYVMTRTRQWKHLGGAIAVLDALRVSTYWNSEHAVRMMWDEPDRGLVHRPARRRRDRSRAAAVVAADLGLLGAAVVAARNLGCEKFYSTAGTPAVNELIAGRTAMVIEPRRQRIWDAMHILPALGAGCSGLWLDTGREIEVDEFHMFANEYLGNPGAKEAVVPPFALFADTGQFYDARSIIRQHA